MLNKKLSFIILTITLFNLSKSSKSLLDQAREDAEKTFTCYPKIIGFVLDIQRDEVYQSKKSTDEMKEVCPKLDYTCCNMDEITQLKEMFLKGKESMIGVKVAFKNILNLYNKNKNILKNMLTGDKKEQIKECLTEDIYNESDVIFGNISKMDKVNEEKLRKITNDVFKFFSGFGCEICGKNFHTLTESDSKFDENGRKEKQIMYSYDNIKSVFASFNDIDEFWSYIRNIIFLEDLVACYNDGSHKREIDGIDEYLKSFEEIKNNCNVENLEDVMKNKMCRELSMFYGLYNSHTMMMSTFASLNRIYDELVKIDDGTTEKKDSNFKGEDQAIFYEIEKTKLTFLYQNTVFVKENGINMNKNAMNEKIWKNVSILSAILISSIITIF